MDNRHFFEVRTEIGDKKILKIDSYIYKLMQKFCQHPDTAPLNVKDEI